MQSWLLLFRAASRVELLRHNVAGEAGVAPKKEGRFPHITLKTKETVGTAAAAAAAVALLLSMYTAALLAPLSPAQRSS